MRIFASVIFLFASVVHAQKAEKLILRKHPNKMAALVETYSGPAAPGTLVARERFDSLGNLLSKQRFQQGFRQGQSLFLNENGKDTLYILSFKKGLLHGKQTFFDEETGAPYSEFWDNGNLTTAYKWDVEEGGRVRVSIVWGMDIEISDSTVTGKRKSIQISTFYGDTVLRSFSNFSKNGSYTMWYPNGSVKCKGHGFPMTGHMRDTWEYYRPDSSLCASGVMDDPEDMVSECEHYLFCLDFNKPLNDGLPEKLEEYVSEAEPVELDESATFAEGHWQHFDEKGRLNRKYNAYRPELGQEVYEYHENGQLAEIYLTGADTGWSKRWNEAGQLLMHEYQIKRGLNEHRYQYFYPMGQIKAEGIRKNGIPKGTWNYLDSNGHVVAKRHYNESDGDYQTYDTLLYDISKGIKTAEISVQKINDLFFPGPDLIRYYTNGKTACRMLISTSLPLKILSIQTLDTSGNPTGEMKLNDYYRYRYDTLQINTDSVRIYLSEQKRYKINDSLLGTYLLRFDFEKLIPENPAEIITYNAEGQLKRKWRYNAAGQPDSMQYSYFKNGKTKMEALFADGVMLYGTEYYPNGSVRAKITNARMHKPTGQWVAESETYYSVTGRATRHSARATEESKIKYNSSGNTDDLRYEVRDPRIISIMDDSELGQLIDLNR